MIYLFSLSNLRSIHDHYYFILGSNMASKLEGKRCLHRFRRIRWRIHGMRSIMYTGRFLIIVCRSIYLRRLIQVRKNSATFIS